MRGSVFFSRASREAPFNQLHPRVGAFFKDYLSHEKVATFRDQVVLNTHFPPYPSRAFDTLVESFQQPEEVGQRRLYSVTLAVTNRCHYRCWHCYNADRSPVDLPRSLLRELAAQIQDRGAVMVTITGGEPLLRCDLEEVLELFDDRSCLILGTTADGLTAQRAQRLHQCGLFATGISLDSESAEEHDRLRGHEGAHRAALEGLRTAAEAGLYPYVVTVATRELLPPDRFYPFLEFAGQAGALEVHLLEPAATGRLAGREDVLLTPAEKQMILDYQARVAGREDLPVLSTFTYLESSEAFGCGAGLTHLYVDGSGEVCPCNLVPLSFGNIRNQPLDEILTRMRRHFDQPRPTCAGCRLARYVPEGCSPAPPETSEAICREHLAPSTELPRFFRIRQEAREEVGADELREAYDTVHDEYDEFWLSEAGPPIEELLSRLTWTPPPRVFEAGCGTGYATERLARVSAEVVAADLSPGMLQQARQRLDGHTGIRLLCGDAIELLRREAPFDLVFSSWVLGYIPLRPFLAAARTALAAGGKLAFLVHQENSPQEVLEIFSEIVSENPEMLEKRVAFDFPADAESMATLLAEAGFEIEHLQEASITFDLPDPRRVLDHLLKSGAGTAFYQALSPAWRGPAEEEFLIRLAARHPGATRFPVPHEYLACVARKP